MSTERAPLPAWGDLGRQVAWIGISINALLIIGQAVFDWDMGGPLFAVRIVVSVVFTIGLAAWGLAALQRCKSRTT